MQSSCNGAAAPAGVKSGSGGGRVAVVGEEGRQGFGVQEWPDGSKYEGEFLDSFKHGKGRYSWRNGECYEGFFYKDFKHGDGVYCWPTGHKFTGKFYLNRKEGYGHLSFPGGAIFQGLYYSDQRFGPGVVTYPDGRQDVGFWLGQRLLKLCSSVEEGFSLHSFPEYATFMQSSVTEASLIQVDIDRDLLSDEDFILPPGIESYSTDGDHLPLPSARRRELDRLFYGELWEPNAPSHQGYEREPLSTLPLQVRMQAHIHRHRLQAENIGWDVAAVLSLNRDSFGPKGHLEVSSERIIQCSFRGELQAVSQILQTDLVYPDVADSQGQTALIAATVNCHDEVIHLLLDVGADIDKLNSEGMSALAVCHVLYYPFQSLHRTLIEPRSKTPVLMSPPCESRRQISQADFTSRTAVLNTETQITDTNMMDQNKFSQLSEQDSEEPSMHFSHDHSEKINGDSEHLLEEERTETGKEECYEDTEKAGDQQSVREDLESEDEVNINVQDLKKREVLEKSGVECSIQVLDGHISLGSVQWKGKNKHPTQNQIFDSACSARSYNIVVTEEMLQLSAEALSRTGQPQQRDSQETVRNMAAMKIEHRARLNTLKLLLDRGADPNLSRVPMPVLFLAIMAGDTEVVRKLLLCGAHTDIPLPIEKKGFYPLHIAAALPGPEGPEITELLLHAVTDPDARTCDQDEIYEPDLNLMNDKEWLDTSKNLHLKEGGRTALHIACQREYDYLNACKVVALLLSHRASTDLLWSGHSPLSLAIASGNDLAVEELLRGGADPDLPLGCRVGSALCALANFNYHLGGNRIKLLDKLAKAGANILMPVTVGEVVGTAVDFAHYSFHQDLRIADTPFHALNLREREIFQARRQLLGVMSDLLRQTAGQTEMRNVERERHLSLTTSEDNRLASPNGKSVTEKTLRQPAFKFCYHCGRSAFVKLIACGRCLKVFFCSKACKLKAWKERHKEECLQVSASADIIQKSTMFKTQRVDRPLTVMKSKPAQQSLSITVKSLRVPKPFPVEEKVLVSQVNLKENYSYN
ncbi:ankyrin repeat and MYND domain-containing protein 1 [Girardinichthys multiradiatus]|uniref:ankyrin repeat and MYND domain-containing protein 1 n=1 Tax=Girardinichthys multiradiatus TaxID=208333 RepID=UPI001FAB5202|nr:ankyrin repeat and MYND domain-containing protein 1 [Girardinichthys multiradiatus]